MASAINLNSMIPEGQLRAFEDAIEAGKAEINDTWKDEHHRIEIAGVLRELLRYAPLVPDVLGRRWHSTLDLLVAGLIPDYEQTGAELEHAFEHGIRILSALGELVQTFQAGGGTIDATGLTHAIDETKKLRAAVMDNWPNFTETDLTDAMTAFAHGECLDAEEAFAQIAGIEKKKWLELLEERQKVKQS